MSVEKANARDILTVLVRHEHRSSRVYPILIDRGRREPLMDLIVRQVLWALQNNVELGERVLAFDPRNILVGWHAIARVEAQTMQNKRYYTRLNPANVAGCLDILGREGGQSCIIVSSPVREVRYRNDSFFSEGLPRRSRSVRRRTRSRSANSGRSVSTLRPVPEATEPGQNSAQHDDDRQGFHRRTPRHWSPGDKNPRQLATPFDR